MSTYRSNNHSTFVVVIFRARFSEPDASRLEVFCCQATQLGTPMEMLPNLVTTGSAVVVLATVHRACTDRVE